MLSPVHRIAVACCLLSAIRGDARADDATDARAHYEAAQRLYDEGKYDEAIDEFEFAYRKKPHPNVLYNIGQAYERLLDYDASVRAFERYLAEADASDPRRKLVENRLRVLRGLPARISIDTIPDHVRITLRDLDEGTVQKGESPRVFSSRAGRYEVTLEQTGWQTERHELVAEIGQPYFYQYRLERSMADASIESDPPGARVFIDERLVGETPYRGRLEVGTHSLLLEYPDFPWHKEALVVESSEPIRRKVRLERPPRSGRTELVIGAMAYGGIVGPLLVGALAGSTQFTQAGQGVATLLISSVAGIGAGFATAWLSTRDGVPVGTSSLLIGGGAFGSGIGAALALGLNADERSIYGITLLGGAVGITAAALTTRFAKISAGDAALVNSGGLWGAGGAALLAQAAVRGADVSTSGWFVLGGTALGLTAGALSAKFLERSRSEVAMVDLGGLIGTGLGFALGYAVGTNGGSDNGIAQGARFALGGMAVGLVSGAIVARRWSKRRAAPKLGHATLEQPQLRFELARTPEGSATRVSLDVLRGSW